MPHAQCLCATWQVVPELSDVADRLGAWVDGGEDAELDAAFGEWKAGKPALTRVEMKVAANEETPVKIRKLADINLNLLEGKFGKIQTSETILTEERAAHIQERHPEDYALFEKYGVQTIREPDLILVDEKHEGTVLMIRKTKDTNLNAIVRLVLPGEDEKRKNSVMTFYRIRDKNVEKLKKKSEILYSKE